MFKTDSRKNRLKHKICLKLTIKLPKGNLKTKSITVNKHMFKVASLTTDFEYVSLYLVKIIFITSELNRYFWITKTRLEDNSNSKTDPDGNVDL